MDCNEKKLASQLAHLFLRQLNRRSTSGFSFSLSPWKGGTHMFDRLTKKIIAAVVIIVVTDKMRTWAKK